MVVGPICKDINTNREIAMDSSNQSRGRTRITKILFVCSLNKFRSLTAEKMYDRFDWYQVRSRGTEKGARIKITEGDVGWRISSSPWKNVTRIGCAKNSVNR